MYRPMLYVDVRDTCKAYETYASKILGGAPKEDESSLSHIVNVYYPRPITILELAEIIKKAIIEHTNGKVRPEVQIIDKGLPPLFNEDDKRKIKVNVEKAMAFLAVRKLRSPEESLSDLVKSRLE
jgi:nucleoside-diphosphate-sugar epimerase